jgi:hypothetical protein
MKGSHMNTKPLKPIVAALSTILFIGAAQATEAPPRLKGEISMIPGRTISTSDEEVLSTAARQILHHVGRARAAVAKKEKETAEKELSQIDALLDVIRDNAPTTVVKQRIMGANDQVRYENSEEVGPAEIPIYSLLGEREDFKPERLAPGKALSKTPGKEAGKPATKAELEASSTMLYYEELDLPIQSTQHWVAATRAAMGAKNFNEADAALRAIQDGVDFVGVYLPEPLVTAKVNLLRAHEHYNAGKNEEARADLKEAIEQLDAAEKHADAETKTDAQKLLDDAQALRKRMDGGETGLGAEFKRIWRHTEALADRAVESTEVGWSRLRNHDAIRADLIEAKRYVAYADIDANVARDAARAKSELERAKSFMDKAATDASGKAGVEVAIKDARAVLDTLIAGQAKTDPGEMANLKRQLGQVIHTL